MSIQKKLIKNEEENANNEIKEEENVLEVEKEKIVEEADNNEENEEKQETEKKEEEKELNPLQVQKNSIIKGMLFLCNEGIKHLIYFNRKYNTTNYIFL